MSLCRVKKGCFMTYDKLTFDLLLWAKARNGYDVHISVINLAKEYGKEAGGASFRSDRPSGSHAPFPCPLAAMIPLSSDVLITCNSDRLARR